MKHLALVSILAIAFAACSDNTTPVGPEDSVSDLAGVSGDGPQFAPKPCVEGDPRGKCGDDGGGGGGGEPSPSTVVTFADRAGDNIRSDLGGSYTDGTCGVVADFNLTDARLDPDGQYKGKDKRKCGDPRALTFEWDQPDDDGATKATRVDGIFMNIDGVESETGVDILHNGQFNLCNRLIFNPDDSGEPNNRSDRLLVSFDDGGNADPADDTWTVRTQASPNDKGYCVGDGRLWHMPFEMTIQRK